MKKILFAVFLLMACPIGSLAKTGGAILAPAEQVQVNGQQVARSSTVFPGDRIQTAQKGYALIRSSELLVSVGGDSSIEYDGASVALERGVATVTASKGMETHFGNLVITTDPVQTSKFSLISANGMKRITVLEGSLKISDGTHLASLRADEMMAPAPPGDPRASGYSSLPGWVIKVIMVGAIAGATAGVLAVTTTIFGRFVSTSLP